MTIKADDFKECRRKSKYLHQFECSSCESKWWGGNKNTICRDCRIEGEKLPPKRRVGIGWFICKCGRRYAGFSRGDITSKCHECQTENLPRFIGPGSSASKKGKFDHYCSACRGHKDCPIVEEAKRSNNHQPPEEPSNVQKQNKKNGPAKKPVNLGDVHQQKIAPSTKSSVREHRGSQNCPIVEKAREIREQQNLEKEPVKKNKRRRRRKNNNNNNNNNDLPQP